MSETVHDLRAEMLERVSWRETTDLGRLGYGIASTAIDEVFAVFREHGIKLCRADYEVHDLVPLTDEEIGGGS